jgi:hypothetical protein
MFGFSGYKSLESGVEYESPGTTYWGWDTVVGTVTGHGLDGPGIESRWGEVFRTCSDRPWGLSSLLYSGYRVFPGGKAAGAWR